MPELANILHDALPDPVWADIAGLALCLILGALLCRALGVFRCVRRPSSRVLCVLVAATIVHAGAITARSKDTPPGPGPGPGPGPDEPTNPPPSSVSFPAFLLPASGGLPERASPVAAPLRIITQ